MAIFLDLDGPILDVSERYYRVHRDILAAQGLPDPPGDRRLYWRMRRAGRALSAVLARAGATAINESEYKQMWLERIESEKYLRYDKVIPAARKAVSRLRPAGTLILVTLRRNRAGLESQLERLKLRGLFQGVLSTAPLTTDSWTVKRDLIRSSPFFEKSSWVVGDSAVDILAGKALGLTTVGVLSGISNRRRMAELVSDFIIEDLRGLREILEAAQRTK